MRPLLVATIPIVLAASACGPRVQYLQTTETVTHRVYSPTYAPPPGARPDPQYPGSYIDARGYRVDAGSRYSGPQALLAEPEPTSPAQAQARRQRESQRSGRAVAWNHNGYHYDYYGNLVRVDR
jgi:hypothetical protein